jgi:hypothetical protein
MAIDSTHPDCFERRDGLYVLNDPDAESRRLELIYDEWDARVKSRMPLARTGWGWYTPFTRYGTPVLLAVAGYLLVTGIFHWPIAVGILIALLLGAIGIPWGRSTASAERSSAQRDRLTKAIRLAGPMPPAPAATRVPPTVVAAAPAHASSAELRSWSLAIGDYESRLERLPVIRRDRATPRYIGRGEYAGGPDDIREFESQLRERRPAYVQAMDELGLPPQPEPAGLA